MADTLVRFGVAMESALLEGLDKLVAARGTTRSEALRDLVRAEISRTGARSRVHAVASLTLVYNHHVRDLSDRLVEMQHALGEKVRSSMHVHLDQDLCLETIILVGRANELAEAADHLLSTRGVTHGGIEIVALEKPNAAPKAHAHGHPRAHRSHRHAIEPAARRGKAVRGKRRVP